MTTMPSLTMSEAMVPVKVSPCCVVAAVEGLGDADGEGGPWVEGDVAEGGWWWRRRRWRRLHGRWGGVGYLWGGSFSGCGLADYRRGLLFGGSRLL